MFSLISFDFDGECYIDLSTDDEDMILAIIVHLKKVAEEQLRRDDFEGLFKTALNLKEADKCLMTIIDRKGRKECGNRG